VRKVTIFVGWRHRGRSILATGVASGGGSGSAKSHRTANTHKQKSSGLCSAGFPLAEDWAKPAFYALMAGWPGQMSLPSLHYAVCWLRSTLHSNRLNGAAVPASASPKRRIVRC
jgi:hypothetical protein